MIDAFAIVDRLSTYTLGGLVTLILICGYFKLWVWGSDARNTVTNLKADFDEQRKDFERRLLKEEQAKERWMEAAFAATGAIEVLAKTKQTP